MQRIVIKSYESRKSLVQPVIFLIIGLILFFDPSKITKFISFILGGVFLALGISKIIRDSKRVDKTTGDFFYSAMMVVLGIIFIFSSSTIELIVRLIIGIWIIVNALNSIAIGANLMKVNKNSILTLLIGFVLLILGLYTIFVSNLVFSTIGLVITIYAVLEIVNYFYIEAKSKWGKCKHAKN